MNFRYLQIATVCAAIALSLPVHAAFFECAFLQEKHAAGKSNKASCSMLPEKVYSTKWYTPKQTEHCDIDKVHSYEDIEDVIINTEVGIITWKKHYGLTEDAKTSQKRYYIEHGDSEEEADKKVNFEKKQEEYFQIKSHHVSEQNIWIDEVTGKLLDPPKKIPYHNLMFTDGRSMFYLYIPESSGHAILLEPNGMADSSWVEMRFGRCRSMK